MVARKKATSTATRRRASTSKIRRPRKLTMTKREVGARAQSIGVSTRRYKEMTPAQRRFSATHVGTAIRGGFRPRKTKFGQRRPAVENPRFRKRQAGRGPRGAKGSRKLLGPPKVGFRTVKGRGGRRITIKRPRPRNV